MREIGSDDDTFSNASTVIIHDDIFEDIYIGPYMPDSPTIEMDQVLENSSTNSRICSRIRDAITCFCGSFYTRICNK